VPESHDFFTLAESMEVAVFFVQGTALRYVNPAAGRMTGYTREELLAMQAWEFIHPDQRAIVRERVLACHAGTEFPRYLEYKLRTKDGETVWVDFSASRIEHDGRPAMLGTAVDVTAHKHQEEALRASQEKLRRFARARWRCARRSASASASTLRPGHPRRSG
jgi:PAS domain S-box-containing protein